MIWSSDPLGRVALPSCQRTPQPVNYTCMHTHTHTPLQLQLVSASSSSSPRASTYFHAHACCVCCVCSIAHRLESLSERTHHERPARVLRWWTRRVCRCAPHRERWVIHICTAHLRSHALDQPAQLPDSLAHVATVATVSFAHRAKHARRTHGNYYYRHYFVYVSACSGPGERF